MEELECWDEEEITNEERQIIKDKLNNYYEYDSKVLEIFTNCLDSHLWILGEQIYSREDLNELFNRVVEDKFKIILEA